MVSILAREKWNEVKGIDLSAGVKLAIKSLGDLDPQKAKVLEKYFRDMTLSIREMYRVLRRGRAAILVVGPSTMRGLHIQTHEHLASIAREIGFRVEGIVRRALNRDRRMMPARLNNNGQSAIELRIHEEFVIGLVKPRRE